MARSAARNIGAMLADVVDLEGVNDDKGSVRLGAIARSEPRR